MIIGDGSLFWYEYVVADVPHSFWFCWQVSGNAEKAREILVQALEHVQLSKPLLEVSLSLVCMLADSFFFSNIISIMLFQLTCRFCFHNLQALIHFEAIQTLPKRIDYLESLVVKFIVSDLESSVVSSPADREELSCIFLEVNCLAVNFYDYMTFWVEKIAVLCVVSVCSLALWQ